MDECEKKGIMIKPAYMLLGWLRFYACIIFALFTVEHQWISVQLGRIRHPHETLFAPDWEIHKDVCTHTHTDSTSKHTLSGGNIFTFHSSYAPVVWFVDVSLFSEIFWPMLA